MAEVIKVANLRKSYRDHVAVEDVSFTVKEGEIFGIVGPNGAGKTTTVECIEGLRRPDGGTVRVLGLDPRRDRGELSQRLGAQLQRSELPERLRVIEALRLYGSFYRKPADPERLIEDFGLSEKRNAPFGRLSGGQRQRLSVALALVGSPQVAILDELTTGLDPQARRDTWELIRRVRDGGVTILLVTHFMDEAERLCDRVAVIDAGRVVATGTPAELIARCGARQRVRFRTSGPFDAGLFDGMPEVSCVSRSGDEVLVTGGGDLLGAVSAALARHGVAPAGLTYERATLEDAFVALTGRAKRGGEGALR